MAIIILLRKVSSRLHLQPSSDKRCETGDYHLANFEGLNDQITTSSITERRADFHDDVSKRDGGGCVFTGMGAAECDAAHIIPRWKGDEVSFRILL